MPRRPRRPRRIAALAVAGALEVPLGREDAAEQLGLTAKRLLGLGLIDKVVRDPTGGAHRNPVQMARRLKAVLLNELDALAGTPIETLLENRYRRLRGYGAYEAG